MSAKDGVKSAYLLQSVSEWPNEQGHVVPSDQNSIVTAPLYLSHIPSGRSNRTGVELRQAALEVRRYYPQQPGERKERQ